MARQRQGGGPREAGAGCSVLASRSKTFIAGLFGARADRRPVLSSGGSALWLFFIFGPEGNCVAGRWPAG
eukprot:11166393-Lingulodinium_polyedra.AAC.1